MLKNKSLKNLAWAAVFYSLVIPTVILLAIILRAGDGMEE